MKFNSRVADDNSDLAGLDTQTPSLEQLSTKSEVITPQYTTVPLLPNYYAENDSTLAVFSGVQNDLQQALAESNHIAPQEPISPSAGNNPSAIVPISGDYQIDALLSGYSWDNPSTITYSFISDSGASSYYGSEFVSALSFGVINNIRTILETILEPLINVNFVEVSDSASNYGQIRYMFSNAPDYAYAYYPFSTDPIAGDVHLTPYYEDGSLGFSESLGSYGFETLLHETLHALGLKHPGNYNGSGTGDPPFLPYSEDVNTNTVMTYNSGGSLAATAMPYDIKALQYIYNPKAYNATDTTYSFSSVYGYTANGQFSGSSTTPMKLTIWDSGGLDTLNFSALPFNASGYRFDLGQGGINTSQTDYNGTAYFATGDTSGNTYPTSTNGTAIAYNTTIENAIGSSSNDTIIGNAANNTLNGGRGNDTVYGGSGNDSLNGGDSNDQLYGEAGNDSIYGGSGNDYLESRDGNDQLSGEVGNDKLYSGIGNDNVSGGDGNDSLFGESGNDTLNGGAGIDTLIGGTDNDIYIIDSTTDTITESSGAGTDTVQSSVTYILGINLENLTLTGTGAINGTGNSLSNTIRGNATNNILNGGSGNDTVYGGSGNDYLSGGDSNDQLYGEAGNDSIYGGSGNDYLESRDGNDQLSGEAGNDKLYSGTGNDNLSGGDGNDSLFAEAGNDTLNGGAGNDSLTGGGNNDKFLYNTNTSFTSAAVGIDVITDFVQSSDKIVLDKTTFTAITSSAGTGFSLAREFAIVSSSAAAATSSADIVYNSINGNLFYNQNGASAGFGTGAQFATLLGNPNILATDFLLQA